MEDKSEAISAAIRFYKVPGRRNSTGHKKFPDGMVLVLRAAADDREVLSDCSTKFSLPEEDIRAAARHYLLSILSDPRLTGLGLLGLNPDCDESRARLHRKLLLKWLHPDHNSSVWEQRLFRKISALPKDMLTQDHSCARESKQRGTARVRRRNFRPVIYADPAVGWKLLLKVVVPVLSSAALVLIMLWWLASARQPISMDELGGNTNQPPGLTHAWHGDAGAGL